jgi:hypothetical protein
MFRDTVPLRVSILFNFVVPEIFSYQFKKFFYKISLLIILVRYHCGGWSKEVNSCILNSYMVYL